MGTLFLWRDIRIFGAIGNSLHCFQRTFSIFWTYSWWRMLGPRALWSGSSGPELLSPVFLLSSQFEIIEKLSMNLRHLVISLIDIICQTWYVKTIQAGFHGRIRPIVLIQDLNFRDKHIKPFLVFIFCSDVFHVVWTRSDFIGRGLVLSHTISW